MWENANSTLSVFKSRLLAAELSILRISSGFPERTARKTLGFSGIPIQLIPITMCSLGQRFSDAHKTIPLSQLLWNLGRARNGNK